MAHVNLGHAEVESRESRLDIVTINNQRKLQAEKNLMSTNINDWDCDVEFVIDSNPLHLPTPLQWLMKQAERIATAISARAVKYNKNRTVSHQLVTDEQLKMLTAILGGLGKDKS